MQKKSVFSSVKNCSCYPTATAPVHSYFPLTSLRPRGSAAPVPSNSETIGTTGEKDVKYYIYFEKNDLAANC